MRARMLMVIVAVSSMALDANAANVVEVLKNPVPQYSNKTCQSYSAALLLALKDDDAFPINTAQALRDAEIAIRDRIEYWAGNRQHFTSTGKLDPKHDDIQSAFADYTKSAYRLERKTFTDAASLGDFIGSTTDIKSEQAAPFPIAAQRAKNAVMVSMSRIGADNYASGHFVTVLGVSGPPNSTRKYLIVNSAVKTGSNPAVLLCDQAAPVTQTTYSALSTWTNNLDLKVYPGPVFYAFTVLKN